MPAYLEIEDALQVVDRYRFQISDIELLALALVRPATTVMCAYSISAVIDEGGGRDGIRGAVPPADRPQQTHRVDTDGSDALDQRLPA